MTPQPIPYQPIGGVNSTDDPSTLGEREVVDSRNFLFERGMAVTRPGITKAAAWSSGERPVRVHSFDLSTGRETWVVAQDTPPSGVDNVYLRATDDTLAPGTLKLTIGSNSSIDYVNVISINDNLYITSGVSTWSDVTTGLAVSDAKYRYGLAHISRALGVYKLDVSDSPLEFAWSVAGDPTDWTSAGAGATQVTDATSPLLVLGLLNERIAIGRCNGFHVADPTGRSQPAYTVRAWSREGVGVCFVASWVVEDNVAYFIGPDDVYTFDLSRPPQSIGRKIRRELFGFLKSGVKFIGRVSYSNGQVPRRFYHLFPFTDGTQGTETLGVPHYVYDTHEGNWSKHFYEGAVTGGGWVQRTTGADSVVVAQYVNGEDKLTYWNPDQLLETPAQLVGRVFSIPPVRDDYKSSRAMLQYRGHPSNERVKISLHARLAGAVQGKWIERDLKSDAPDDAGWDREFFDLRVAGQYFQPVVDVPVGSRLELNYLEIDYERSGSGRGSVTS